MAGSSVAGRARTLLDALERKDIATVTAMLDEHVTLTIPLSLDGGPESAGRFVGKEQVLGYLRGVFTAMGVIRFVDVRISGTDDGRTSFTQANGDFTAADGRAYRNVYVLRNDWDGDRVVNMEEYANPVTFLNTFGPPAS